MYRISILIILTLSFLISQERTTLHFASPDDNLPGHIINNTSSIADLFTVTNNYILEGITIWFINNNDTEDLIIEVRMDDNGLPGSVIGEWNLTVFGPLDGMRDYFIDTTSDCVNLVNVNGFTNYWLTVRSDAAVDIIWMQTANSIYTYSTSEDNGENWIIGSENENAGATIITGEEILTFDPGIPEGDINLDYAADILDVVLIVSFILDTGDFNEEEFLASDLNHDNSVDILDVISLIDIILNSDYGMPDFLLTDINQNSDYYQQDIGPSVFDGYVS